MQYSSEREPYSSSESLHPSTPSSTSYVDARHPEDASYNRSPDVLSQRISSWEETGNPYASVANTRSSISAKFSLSPDPRHWGSELNPAISEPDDFLHNPEVKNGKVVDMSTGSIFSLRGLANIGCLALLGFVLLALFIGYPIATYASNQAVAEAQTLTVPPDMFMRNLIDPDTPEDAKTIKDLRDGKEWKLVFSDEFETEGRSFYPGDDPYWEAVSLHYWQTNNLEWYDPAGLTTADGNLVITLSEQNPEYNHNLDYRGGMLSTWNQFCFTGGYIEANVVLPGKSNVAGLWPAIWTMGNLGRAGYGASLEGMWPYSYDACDVGTAPNQTIDDLPEAAVTGGSGGSALSYLQGQRLSRCTCSGESHPGPIHDDGSYVGRSAPEIDIFEAQVGSGVGGVSQSCQWAPFDYQYAWDNTTENLIIADDTISHLNEYLGGQFQEASSVITETDPGCYQIEGTGCFSVYGFQYKPGFDSGYISWVSGGQLAWTVNAAGLSANEKVEISARPIPQEPLYILANLGISYNFGAIDFDEMQFPAIMLIDYVRVYQDPDNVNIGCDPSNFPTQDYINTYNEAYTDANLTTWVDDYGQTVPKNNLTDGCT